MRRSGATGPEDAASGYDEKAEAGWPDAEAAHLTSVMRFPSPMSTIVGVKSSTSLSSI